MSNAEIVETYGIHRERLEKIRLEREAQLQELLMASGLDVHSVSSRLKDSESLSRKVSRPDKTYQNVWDVTDLIGLRVITFFEDTIDEIASLIEKNFEVDFHNSTNKLRQGDFDRFGYRSLHYVCHADNGDRALRFEIQVRTILQHAWAEIEHDLGYKAGDVAPAKIRRRFSRVASLLEIADQEFVSIRADLQSYVRAIESGSQKLDASVDLDVVSLKALIDQPVVEALDAAVAAFLKIGMGQETFYPDYLIRMLRFAGFKDVASPLNAIEKSRVELESLIRPYFQFLETVWQFNQTRMSEVPRGYSLLILVHLAVLESEPLEINKIRRLAELYESVDELAQGTNPIEIATCFMKAVRAVIA